jgi:hypothetical protein
MLFSISPNFSYEIVTWNSYPLTALYLTCPTLCILNIPLPQGQNITQNSLTQSRLKTHCSVHSPVYKNYWQRGGHNFSHRHKGPMHHLFSDFFLFSLVCVPDMETGCCLGSEGNGVSMGGGGEGWPSPLKGEKISSQWPAKAGTTWRRTRRNNKIGSDGGESARTKWAAIWLSWIFINVIAGILILIVVFLFFQENKSYHIKTICIDPLSTSRWSLHTNSLYA